MFMKIFKVLSLSLILLMTACTTTQTSNNVVPENKKNYNASYTEVYSQAVSTLMELKWQVTESNKKEGLIKAKTPMNLLTWGDQVIVYVFEKTENNVLVEVTSSSPQQIDWGKNRSNIEKFYSLLDKKIK